MKNDHSVKNFDGTQAALYPHLKVTNETFPRVLATRKIENDSAEYYGAFLTKTALRILIDFVNRTFRLRSCDIPIDGKFPVPCTQHYHKRCLAPCVESLCDHDHYLAMVDIVRMFLANRQTEFTETLQFRIQLASDALDFEAAAYWRDILDAAEKYWSDPRWNVWLDGDAVDTFEIESDVDALRIFLVTQRDRYILGRKFFNYELGTPIDEAMSEIIHGFYQKYAPKEIRVSRDFTDRKALAEYLSEKFGRPVPITLVTKNTRRMSTSRAVQLTRDETELDAAKPEASAKTISSDLKRLFGLKRQPRRIECFDVAHISGRGFVAAWAVWISGDFLGSEYGWRISQEQSELASLAEAVSFRLSKADRPDLIVLDGGKPQLNAVTEILSQSKKASAEIVAAVKPRGKHSGVSHFLRQSGEPIEFDDMSPSQNLLKILRDDAHDLANRVHRDLRDTKHNYELATVLPSINEAERRNVLRAAGSIRKLTTLSETDVFKLFDARTARKIVHDLRIFRSGNSEPVMPLIVPIRFDDPDGAADDLRPILTSK
jgi:excinuclease ABC subunit C